MKKRVFGKRMVVTIASAMALMLCACGNADSKATDVAEVKAEEVVADAATQETQEASTETAESEEVVEETSTIAEEASTETVTTEEAAEVVTTEATEQVIEETPTEEVVQEASNVTATDWLAANSYSITSQGLDCPLQLEQYVQNADGTFSLIEGAPTFTATVMADNMEHPDSPGFKTVFLGCSIDFPDAVGPFAYQFIVFDRYTGTIIKLPEEDYSMVLESAGKQIPLDVNQFRTTSSTNIFDTGMITCPTDYNGLVFAIARFDINLTDTVASFTNMDQHNELYLKNNYANDPNSVYFFSANSQ